MRAVGSFRCSCPEGYWTIDEHKEVYAFAEGEQKAEFEKIYASGLYCIDMNEWYVHHQT